MYGDDKAHTWDKKFAIHKNADRRPTLCLLSYTVKVPVKNEKHPTQKSLLSSYTNAFLGAFPKLWKGTISFVMWSMYSTVVYEFLLFVHVFLLFSMYTYCCLRILRRGYPDWGFSVLFPRLWGKCQGITSQDGARPALFQNCCVALCIVCFVSFYTLFVCKCVLYFCHRLTTQLQLTNISYHICHRILRLYA